MRHSSSRRFLAAMCVGAMAVAGARAEDVVLLESLSALRTVDTLDGSTRSRVQIKGIDGVVEVLAIDTRPSDRKLYGVTRDRLWVLDPDSGWATPVGREFGRYVYITNRMGPVQGFDFDPVTGAALAFVQGPTGGINPRPNDVLRLDPDTGLLTNPLPVIHIHPRLAYAAGDAGEGKPIRQVLAAHDHNVAGATQTTLFGIDIATRTLIRIGDPDAASPVTGEVPVETIGAVAGLAADDRFMGLEIDASGSALLLTSSPKPFAVTLRRLDLETGGVTSSLVLSNEVTTDFATAPFPTLSATSDLDLRAAVVRFDATRARRNSVELRAVVPVPADGWRHKVIRVDVSQRGLADHHVAREFVLDRRGRASDGPDTLAVTRVGRSPNARAEIRLSGVDLANLGVTADTVSGSLPLDVDLLVDGEPLHAQADLVYTASNGRGIATRPVR